MSPVLKVFTHCLVKDEVCQSIYKTSKQSIIDQAIDQRRVRFKPRVKAKSEHFKRLL